MSGGYDEWPERRSTPSATQRPPQSSSLPFQGSVDGLVIGQTTKSHARRRRLGFADFDHLAPVVVCSADMDHDVDRTSHFLVDGLERPAWYLLQDQRAQPRHCV